MQKTIIHVLSSIGDTSLSTPYVPIIDRWRKKTQYCNLTRTQNTKHKSSDLLLHITCEAANWTNTFSSRYCHCHWLLVLLILCNKVIHVTLRLGEFHLVHSLFGVPMQKELPPKHGSELLIHPPKHHLNRSRILDESRRQAFSGGCRKHWISHCSESNRRSRTSSCSAHWSIGHPLLWFSFCL